MLPIRQSFLSRTSSDGTSVGKPPEPERIKAIQQSLSTSLSTNDSALISSFLPTLFDIAVRAVPRDTFRRQVNEAPWLEALFAAFASRAGYPQTTDSKEDLQVETSVLGGLLQVAINRQVNLSLHSLSQYAVTYSGVMADYNTNIQWPLIAKFIHAGVDVFLPNSGLSSSRQLLENLITQIFSHSQRPEFKLEESYDIVKRDIILPLLQGFLGARDIKTFVEIWFEQLKGLESNRIQNEKSTLFSVWEDDDIVLEYGEQVSLNLLEGQVASEIASAVDSVSAEDSDYLDRYPYVVVLDALASSRLLISDGTVRRQVLERIFNAISQLVTASRKQKWFWRIWRIGHNFLENYPDSSGYIQKDTKHMLLSTAFNTLHSFHRKSQSKMESAQDYFLNAFEAFRFALQVVEDSEKHVYENHLNSFVPTLVSFLDDTINSHNPTWNGRVEELNSLQTLAIGYITVLLSKPSALTHFTSENRRLFFKSIFTSIDLAKLTSTPQVTHEFGGLDSLKLWKSFTTPEWLLQSPPCVYDIVATVYSHLQNAGVVRQLPISSLLNVPVQLIPRHQRAILLDFLQQTIAHGLAVSADTATDILTLMARLTDTPKSSAKITSDWESLWTISTSFSLQKAVNVVSPIQSFRQLYKAVIDRVLVSSDTNRRQYLENSYARASKTAEELRGLKFEFLEIIMLNLTLLTLYVHREHLGDSSRAETLQKLREDVFERTISELQSVEHQLKKRRDVDTKRISCLLACLEDQEDLVNNNKEAHKLIIRIDEHMSSADSEEPVRKQVKYQVIDSQEPEQLYYVLMQQLPFFPLDKLYGEKQRIFFRKIYHLLSSLDEKRTEGFIREIKENFSSSDDTRHQLLLLGMAISRLRPVEDRSSKLSLELTSLFTSLCDLLPMSDSIEVLCLVTESLGTLLRTQSKIITQWNVDHILASVSITASPSGPHLSKQYAATIFTRLCRVLGILFGQYRKKLSGRFHLILPAMQRLLQCLFTPDTRSRMKSSLPPWAVVSCDEYFATTENAVQYTRLLTSLCDPTVSAVQTQKGGRPDSSLTDNTKKVKSLAGQHLQYLVMQYTVCQLHGKLTPDVKTALMPGFYAILDVMSRDTMRAMNASMDSSGRAVFKGLYDDYVRFGRWHHD